MSCLVQAAVKRTDAGGGWRDYYWPITNDDILRALWYVLQSIGSYEAVPCAEKLIFAFLTLSGHDGTTTGCLKTIQI
jgi:hypothetical protein